MITIALEHASADETRPHLAQLRLEPVGDVGACVRMIATDGHRMSVHEAPCAGMIDAHGITREAARALQAALRAQIKGAPKRDRERLRVQLTAGSATCDGTTVTLRMEAEPFPSYAQVIPKYDADRKGETVGLCGDYLAAAAKACAEVSGGRSRGLHVTMGAPLNPVMFCAGNQDMESLTVIVMPMRI